ncbi:PaaX family transcriptional regulator C-terminal domain-containing protein [Nocardia sp. R7R-8]|uniref:PaaX family transcriptional regulator C-terminal domain-containing protein n=1 Tax=Nocardia sp. R7R-8 TaxID=3459304 RepID=UPI00403DEC8D
MTDNDTVNPTGSRQSRHLVVSFLGSIVRRMGNWMPIAGTVEMMDHLDVDGPSVRSAVFRLKKRGWLISEARAGARGYRLTDLALRELAAGDELIWHARQPADLRDGWCIVNFSVPESARSTRHQLRTRLANLGFGNVGYGVWIAPARMLNAAKDAIADLGLTQQSAVFVGEYAGGQDLGELIHQLWDLDRLDRNYRDFIATHGPSLDRVDRAEVLGGQEAYTTYLTVVDRWRNLPFRDPGLPLQLLGDDWGAPAAARLFENIVQRLEGRALAYAAGHWPVPDLEQEDRSAV